MKKDLPAANLHSPPPPAWFVFTGFSSALIVTSLLERVNEFFQSPEPAYLIGVPWLALLGLAGWAVSQRLPLALSVLDQVAWSACLVYYLPQIFALSTGSSWAARLILVALALLPVGFFLGLPQVKGLTALQAAGFPAASHRIAWLLHCAGWAAGIVLTLLSEPLFGLDALQLLGALFLASSLLAVRKRSPLFSAPSSN